MAATITASTATHDGLTIHDDEPTRVVDSSAAFARSAATFANHIKGHIGIAATPKSVIPSALLQAFETPSLTPSGTPEDVNDITLLTKALPPIDKDIGRIPVPELLPRPNGSCSVATKTREQWSTISADEAVSMLFDINSPVGEADLALWTDDQLKHLVDVIEPEQWAIMTSKSGAFGQHVNGVDITFKNLFYRKNNTQRLNNISGYIRAGSMVAVVGAPDAGITTLFDVLTGRQRGGAVSGEILINGRQRDSSFDRLVGYITKEDIHQPILTVKETLMFSAQLRADGIDRSKRAMSTRVDIVMKMLGIRGTANTIVGDATMRGISGGEKRRTSIASELVAGHPVIVADLPTNGLDSATAFDIMRTLKHQTRTGASIITSLAQPSPELLNLFDTVMVLSKGSCIYFGPRAEAIPYFEALGFPCPPEKQYPDFIEELSAIPHKFYVPTQSRRTVVGNDNTISSNDKVVPVVGVAPPPSPVAAGLSLEATLAGLVLAYRDSDAYHHLSQQLFGELSSSEVSKKHILQSNDNYRYNVSFFSQLHLTMARQFLMLVRTSTALKASAGAHIFVALVLGSLFWQLGNAQADARTRVGMLSYMLDFVAISTNALVPYMMMHRNIYYPQSHRGYFRSFAYYVSSAISTIPQGILESLIMALIVYSMTGLYGTVVVSSQWWYFWVTLFVYIQTAKSYFISVAAAMPTIPSAMAIAPTVCIVFFFFSGFLAPRDSIPSGWRWINTISFEKYPLKGIVVNELYNMEWSCNPGETLIPELDACQLSNGHDALRLYDMDVTNENEKWTLLGYEAIFYLIFNTLAALATAFLDWSNTDTAELPNFKQQDVKKKKQVAVVEEAVADNNGAPVTASPAVAIPMDVSKPPPVYISWNNLTYIVDIPKRKPEAKAASSSAPAAATAANDAKESKESKQAASDIEMAPVKESDSADEGLVVEQLVDDVEGKRTLLKDVYGYAKPGMMVALMGGSGAGKTTLLDVLAGKKTGGDIINDALVNGKPRDKSFSRIAGYVEQFDSHDELATVREAVVFSAMLRLPSSMEYEAKIARVDEVIHTLRLSHVQHQRIGGVSPEIRKKVTIAVELVMNPGLLFLDEPTTGLDSAGALAVMHAVKSLSASITVICTIHQPSIEIVNCFSHVLLMNKWEQRGRVAFFGEVKNMPVWFGANNLGTFHDGNNIAEFGLESLQVAGKAKINVASMFLQSAEGKAVQQEITAGVVPVSSQAPLEYSRYATSFANQVFQITKRFFIANSRNVAVMMSRYGTTTVTALIGGILFYHSALNQKGAQNRVALMTISAVFPIFGAMAPIPDLVSHRSLYFREKTSSMYSPFAYYLGRMFGDQPFILIEGFLWSCIIYFMAGLRTDDNGTYFGMYLLGWYIIRNLGSGFIECIAGIAPHADAAAQMSGTFFSLGQLFAGFFIRRTAIPAGWIWMHYISFFKYSISFFAMSELHGLDFSCPNNLDATYLDSLAPGTNLTSLVAASKGIITCQGADGGEPCYACPIISGDAMLNVFDFDASDKILMLGCMIIWMVAYRALSLYVLKTKNWISK